MLKLFNYAEVNMYKINTRIGGSKIGTDGKLKLSSAIDILQDCSQLWLESEPELLSYLNENGCGIFLTSRQVSILRRPYYGENVARLQQAFTEATVFPATAIRLYMMNKICRAYFPKQ